MAVMDWLQKCDWSEFLIAFFIVKGIRKKKKVQFQAYLREHLSRVKLDFFFLMSARAVMKMMQ